MSFEPPAPPRNARADAQRNRIQLLAAARALFTARGAEAPLEEVARQAGVGIGTLYRHFPTREALLSEVYRTEVEHLVAAADRGLDRQAPGAALEEWLHQLIDYMQTKRVIAPALQASPAAASAPAAGPVIAAALGRLTRAAIASGEIRADVRPEDLTRLLGAVAAGYGEADWAQGARRLIGVIMAGLRAPPKDPGNGS